MRQLLAIFILSLTVPLAAQDAAVSAADLVHAISDADLETMAAKIPLPRVKDSAHIICDVKIDHRGRMEGGCLFNGHAGRQLTTKFQRTLHKFKVRPASVAGKPVEVQTQISVFLTSGESPKISITRNDAAHIKQFGMNYVAPQRIDKINFIECPMWGKISTKCKDNGLKFTIDSQIDERGTRTSCQIRSTSKSGTDPGGICEQQIAFVPGFVDGVPTAMRHIEPWF